MFIKKMMLLMLNVFMRVTVFVDTKLIEQTFTIVDSGK